MEAVQHVAGVAEVGVDGGLVGLGAVADDDFDSLAPSVWPCCIRNADSAAELRCSTIARVLPVSPLTITVT